MSEQSGDLTTSWRIMLAGAWIAAFFAYAAIWQATVQIGFSTWWVGPRSQPTNAAIKLLPFFLVLAVALWVIFNVQRVIIASVVGVILTAGIAIPDFSRSTRIAITELAITALLGLVTVAAATGRLDSERG
jgi:hypothetical protein